MCVFVREMITFQSRNFNDIHSPLFAHTLSQYIGNIIDKQAIKRETMSLQRYHFQIINSACGSYERVVMYT